jgi:hypothetical protein
MYKWLQQIIQAILIIKIKNAHLLTVRIILKPHKEHVVPTESLEQISGTDQHGSDTS